METMMALGIVGVLLAILNYADLNSKNRIAMDTMTRDIPCW